MKATVALRAARREKLNTEIAEDRRGRGEEKPKMADIPTGSGQVPANARGKNKKKEKPKSTG